MDTVWLGEMEYQRAHKLQIDHVDLRIRSKIPNTLLLLTHPHVYTFGRNGRESNLLVSQELLRDQGISAVRVSRGGDVTYHGPGQLVGYPIVQLVEQDIHRYVRALEAALIDAIHTFGVPGRAIAGYAGVWTGEKKIASIGVGVRRWVTYHGFALNVSTDLSYFRKIHLCGLQGKEATSISEYLGHQVALDPVCEVVATMCCRRLEALT